MLSEQVISFEALFNHASLGIVIVDEGEKIILANPFLLNQFQYTQEELTGQPIERLIPPRFHIKHKDHVNQYNEHPKSRPMGLGMVLFACRKDGSEFPVEVSLGNYHTEEGRYVIAFLSDITKRAEAEEALKQLNAELEDKIKERTQSLTRTVKQLAQLVTETEAKDADLNRANNFLKNIWDNAQAIIFVTDKDGKIKMFNPTAQRQLGYEAEELLGKASPDIFMNLQDTMDSGQEWYEQLSQKTESGFSHLMLRADLGISTENEVVFVHKNGSAFPVSLTLSAMQNIHLEIDGYLAIAIDISERKKAETDLKMALQKEKELSELKSRFVSMASHEFRTPLSSVLSSVYLLAQYTSKEKNPKIEKHLNRIVSSVNMLTDILNDFLSVGKIEEGKIQVRYSSFCVSEHLEAIINELNAVKKRGQKIRYVHMGGEQVYLDPTIIKHIVINLVSNAIKFSAEDSDIEITTEKKGHLFFLRVSDKGIGMSEEDQRHLFERFYRGTNVTNIQGTGLGLHIVNKYVELMKGRICCQSVLGEGTTFELTFEIDNL